MWSAPSRGKEETVQSIRMKDQGQILATIYGRHNVEQLNLEQFKAEIHRTLIPKLDLEKLSRVNSNLARHAVARMIGEIISSQRVPLSLS